MTVTKLPPAATVTAEQLQEMKLYELARVVRRTWPKVNFAAKPYLEAMESLTNITDNYVCDSGASIVAYFLSNAGTYKGPDARLVKTELKRRMEAYYGR